MTVVTLTSVHHCTTIGSMRLTVNLEPELYALAKSLAQAEDCSISAAVNRLLRRSLPGEASPDDRLSDGIKRRHRLLVSRGRRPVAPDTIRRSEAEDDAS